VRRIIASMLTTVDGYFEGPDREFVPPPWNEQLTRYSDDITSECDTIIYGRISFEMNKAYWQQAETDPSSDAAKLPFAHKMNSLRKLVFSRTLPDEPGWNARVIRELRVDEMEAIKRQPGKDMVMFGSAQLLASLMAHDLVDEYRFIVNPLLLGAGAPLFRGGHARLPLELVSCQALDNGVLMVRYRRAR
jgi:dihydrofolate reductase